MRFSWRDMPAMRYCEGCGEVWALNPHHCAVHNNEIRAPRVWMEKYTVEALLRPNVTELKAIATKIDVMSRQIGISLPHEAYQLNRLFKQIRPIIKSLEVV